MYALNDVSLQLLLVILFGYTISLVISYKVIRTWLVFLVVSIRFGFLIYYIYFGDYIYLKDDLIYYQNALMFLEKYSVLDLFSNSESIAYAMQLSGGKHISYMIYGSFFISFFYESYFTPIVFNVVLSIFSGVILYSLSRLAEFPRNYSIGLSLFFTLAPAVFVWSSYFNIKESLLVFLILLSFYLFSSFIANKRRMSIFALSIVIFALLFTRFYILLPIFFAMAFYFVKLNLRNFFYFLCFLIFVVFVAYFLNLPWHLLQLGGVFSGVSRFLLTPQPWTIVSEYKFLLIPSIVNWLLFVPMVLGIALLWLSNRRFVRSYIVFALLLIGLYGVFPELQGPRHRFVIYFVLSWAQFHTIYYVLKRITARSL